MEPQRRSERAPPQVVPPSLNADKMRLLLDYTAQQTSGIGAWSRDAEHMEKAFLFAGKPAAGAVLAATLIQSGWSGVDDVFSGPDNFLEALAPRENAAIKADPTALVDKLERALSEITRTNIKKWTVGSPIQAPLDALAGFFKQRSFSADDVRKVVVRVATDEANTVSNRDMPDICMQHMVAIMLLDKTVTFRSVHDRARMKDPAVLRQRAKVEVIADPRIDARRPRREAIVELTLTDGTQLTEWVRDVRGTAENPMTREEVVDKARDLIAPVLGNKMCSDLIAKLLALETLRDVRELRPVLQRELTESMLASTDTETATAPRRRKPFYTGLSFHVLLGVAIAIVLGYVSPTTAVAMKPLGDAFIRLITMIITLVIFCTLVTGIAGMEDMKKVGRVGGKALLYFEIVSTLALLIGLIVGNAVHPGSGFNADPATLDAKAVAGYAGQAKAEKVTEFLVHIIPNTIVDAFTRGDILQVLFVSLLFGFALSLAGPRCKPLLDLLDALTRAVFGVVTILMRFAPIGAFGAMAFTIGKYGLASLGPLVKLMATLYITALFFVVVVLGGIARLAGFRNPPFPLVSSRRNSPCAGHKLHRTRPACFDGQAGKARVLQGPRRPRCPHGLHVQRRRHESLYDPGRIVCGSSHEHASDALTAIHDSRGRPAHLKRRKRRTRCGIHRARRHHDGHPDHSCRRNGPHSGHRSFPQHVPRRCQHDWQRRGNSGCSSMGKRSRSWQSATESSGTNKRKTQRRIFSHAQRREMKTYCLLVGLLFTLPTRANAQSTGSPAIAANNSHAKR